MQHGDAKLSAVTGVRWKDAMGGRRWVVRIEWLSLIGLWGSLPWGPGAVSALPIDYFALGDSVASGYGLADDETACHQSMLAYPWQLYARLQETFVVHQFDLLACSGTTTGAESLGHYVWLAAFIDPGTGMFIGTIAQASFTVSP
jgi:hypothetical protein